MHLNNTLNTPSNLVFNQAWPEVYWKIIPYVRSTNGDTLVLDNYQLFKIHIIWGNNN